MNLFSAVATLVFLTAGIGRAALRYADFRDMGIPGNSAGIYINPIAGVITATPPQDFESAPWINLLFGGTAIGSSPLITLAILDPATGNGDGLVMKLPGGAEIGPAAYYTIGANGSENHTGPAADQFQSGEPGYLGFATAEGNYGWICITVSATGEGVIHAAAMEASPGIPILAGAVPEPGVAVLCLAAAALLLRRRRAPVPIPFSYPAQRPVRRH